MYNVHDVSYSWPRYKRLIIVVHSKYGREAQVYLQRHWVTPSRSRFQIKPYDVLTCDDMWWYHRGGRNCTALHWRGWQCFVIWASSHHTATLSIFSKCIFGKCICNIIIHLYDTLHCWTFVSNFSYAQHSNVIIFPCIEQVQFQRQRSI